VSAREIHARGIVRGTASGPALVSTEPISFLGDLDIRTGSVVNKRHPLLGVSLKGSVLVLPHSIGSAGAWRFLYQLYVHNTNPVAIVQHKLPDSDRLRAGRGHPHGDQDRRPARGGRHHRPRARHVRGGRACLAAVAPSMGSRSGS
jgi:hypothetical protein